MARYTDQFAFDSIVLDVEYEYAEIKCCNGQDCGCYGNPEISVAIISVFWYDIKITGDQIQQIEGKLIEMIEEKHEVNA